jgi:hypothetical protein
MKQNRHLSGIKSMILVAAVILISQAFGFSVAKAQQKVPADDVDRELFKSPDLPRFQDPASGQNRSSGWKVLPGSNAPGNPATDPSPRGGFTTNTARSNCFLNAGPQPASGFSCSIFESDANGSPSETSNVITLPNVVVGGFVVLKDSAAFPDSDTAHWSDVLKIGDGTAANTTTMQLLSAGCGCFPSFATVSANPNLFLVETQTGLGNDNTDFTVFNSPPNVYMIHSAAPNVGGAITAPARPWTAAGSTGTVDEDSAALVQLKNFTVTFVPGSTGTVTARYNITATDGVSAFCPANQSVIRVRFRNSDNTGTTAKVNFEIHSSSVSAGGNTTIFSFNSNGIGNGLSFTTATFTTVNDFDFANNIYWIEATVFRSDANQFSDLGSIQIWEAAGTPCP